MWECVNAVCAQHSDREEQKGLAKVFDSDLLKKQPRTLTEAMRVKSFYCVAEQFDKRSGRSLKIYSVFYIVFFTLDSEGSTSHHTLHKYE
ncbi:uncharacterized protein V6R79_004610 [Siganus canaliculatus]